MKNHMEPFTLLNRDGPVRETYLFPEMVNLESAKSADHDLQYVSYLRQQNPEMIITAVPQVNANIKAWADAGHARMTLDTDTDSYASWKGYVRPQVRSGVGALGEAIQFAKYQLQWKDESFIIYTVQVGFSSAQYILKDRAEGEGKYGPSQTSDALIMTVGEWQASDNEVIWIFAGFWRQDRNLYKQVRDASWDKVILDEGMKKDLTSVASTFFASKQLYKDLGVPWKRGLLFHGPPGNGKTVSIKALMHTLLYDRKDDPIPTLYVRDAPYTYMIGNIFALARQLAPCMLVLEDIESIVNINTRSYFFNELDGLDNNDGILVVATTNYLERLDPGLTKRPSRFDRKYLFPLPDEHERLLYTEFWRKKLTKTHQIDFPAQLCPAMARITPGFSFAFLQECFVATMLSIVHNRKEDSLSVAKLLAELADSDDLDKYELWREFKKQANLLRKQIDDEEMLRSTHAASPRVIADALSTTSYVPPPQTYSERQGMTSTHGFEAYAGEDYPRGYLPFEDRKQPEANTSIWQWVGPRQ